MIKYSIICDRILFGALLGMVFFIPFSLALIGIFQALMAMAWILKHFFLNKEALGQTPRAPGLNLFSNSMGWALIAIGLLIILTVPFSHYPALSIKKFGTRFLIQIFLMYLVTESIHSRKRLYYILSMLLMTLFLVSLDAMVQYTWGKSIVHHTTMVFRRVTGPMNHPNDLGTLLVTVLPVILVLTLTPRKRIPWQVLVSLLFLLLVITLGLTGSRGAWFSFTVSMVTLGFYLKNRKLAVLIFLMLSVFFWVFGVYCLSTRTDLVPLNQNIGSSNVLGLLFSPDGRQFYWGTALNVIKHYPWIGCGYSSYVQTLKDLNVGHTEYPHNSLLHIAAELGILGLVLYGWFFTALVLNIKNVLRVVSHERDLFLIGCGLSCGILAWFVHSLMDTAWGSLQLNILWWLLIGILLSLVYVLPNHKASPDVMSKQPAQ